MQEQQLEQVNNQTTSNEVSSNNNESSNRSRVNSLKERIKRLEEEKAKLIAARKEEIAGTVIRAGGIDLDNRLLAGFCVFASDPANSNSELLKMLLSKARELKMPRSRAKSDT